MSSLNLKEYRVKCGFNQSDIATILGVTQSQYHKLETGKSLANSKQIIQLCNIFRCTPNDLFGIYGDFKVSMAELDQD